MYADRHAYSSGGRSSGIDPRSLGIAVALNGAVVAALLLAQPVFKIVDHTRTLTTYPVPIEPPPPPLPPEPTPRQTAQHQAVSVPRPEVSLPTPTTPVTTTEVILPLQPVTLDPGPVTPTATPTPALVTVGPEVDPAHRGDLQPAYPATELRAEREGSVVVRVLVGTDGRVHQVEQVSATSDAFFRATQERALARWRFRPATRGGVPVEAWRTMTIRFVIPR